MTISPLYVLAVLLSMGGAWMFANSSSVDSIEGYLARLIIPPVAVVIIAFLDTARRAKRAAK